MLSGLRGSREANGGVKGRWTGGNSGTREREALSAIIRHQDFFFLPMVGFGWGNNMI